MMLLHSWHWLARRRSNSLGMPTMYKKKTCAATLCSILLNMQVEPANLDAGSQHLAQNCNAKFPQI
jgi:hypothetical protein